MAPVPLRKLLALQCERRKEIEKIRTRLTSKPRKSLSKIIVQSRIDATTKVWEQVRETHSKIIVREDAAMDPYVAEDMFGQLEVVYEDVLDEFLNVLPQMGPADTSLEVNTSINSHAEGMSNCPARLSKIPLPTFLGNYEDWDSFCDLFTSLVHEAPRISEATKLQYLKLCMKGSAADLIKDVMTTNANYASTWQALKDRYHNPRLIIHKHLSALLELPYLKKESATELRSFADEAQRLVRALSNLRLPVEHWDVWFIFIFSQRFDPESRKAWELELSDRDKKSLSNREGNQDESEILACYPKFSVFVEFLKKRAQGLSQITPERRAEKRSSTFQRSGPPPRKVCHIGLINSLKCPLCTESYVLIRCPQFNKQTPDERRSAVKRLQLCFNCLGQHLARNCTSKGRCRDCGNKHHFRLYVEGQGTSQHPHNSTKANNGSDSGSPIVSLHAAISLTPKRILLATARVNPNGKSTFVRALLDQGSEVSFISENVVQLLGLPRQRTCLPLSELGACSVGTAKSLTHIQLCSPVDASFQLDVEVLILPRLTSLLLSNDLTEKIDFKQFYGWTLADPRFWLSDKIDLVLGLDIYGQLLRLGLRRSTSSRLVAQDKSLGGLYLDH